MKIRNSLKSLKGRHRDNRVIRRRGRTYVINKTNRRFKARQGKRSLCARRGAHRCSCPLPHPATHMILPLDGRVGERAGVAQKRALPRVFQITPDNLSTRRR